jgi:hypothetical protein
MNEEKLLLGWLPNHLSDEAAYELCVLMRQMTEIAEQKYYAQIRRHVMSLQPPLSESLDFWRDEQGGE